jgi:hypothetical protein
MSAALAILAFLYAFWALYVLVMGIYRAHLSGRLSRAGYVLGLPWVILGYLVDVFAQFTVATVLFADWPRRGEWLVTDRLQRYMRTRHGWRYHKAKWICDSLLDPFDVSGDQC